MELRRIQDRIQETAELLDRAEEDLRYYGNDPKSREYYSAVILELRNERLELFRAEDDLYEQMERA